MTEQSQAPDLAIIRQQLRDTFTADTLPRFCQDCPVLRPIVDHFGPKCNLLEMIDEVIDYCDKRHLLDELLAEVERYDPSQYAAAAPYQAPRPLPEFVGRHDELQHLADTLQPGTRTAITGLVGMGGLGKAELAKLAASRVAGRFRDGVLWADCGQQEPATIADLWSAAYSVQLPGDDAETKATAWRGLVANKEALLIFDNVQPRQEVEPLFPPRGRSAVLLTTRHAGHPALHGAERLDLNQFTLDEANALTVEVLGPENAQAQAEDAAHLFKLLGYLPLGIAVALHLAASAGWALSTLNSRLEGAGALAVLGGEQAMHKSLNATFEAVWANLPADLQEVFRTLSLFNHGPSFSALALADTLELDESEALRRLNRLARRSLLTDEDDGRWSLHPLLREFAAGRGPVDEATWLRMARHYEGVVRAADSLYKQGGEGVLRGLALFDLELPHIQAGQAWAAERAGEDDEATRLCRDFPSAGAQILELRLHPRQHLHWLEAAAGAASLLNDKPAEAKCMGGLGRAHWKLGDMQQAVEYLEQALAIAQEIGDRRGEGKRLGNLGNAYADLGDVRQAIKYLEQALAIAQEIGDRRDEGIGLNDLGVTYAALGDLPSAIKCFEQALAIAQEIGDRRGEANRLANLGNAHADLGDVRQAIKYLEGALAITQEIRDRRVEGASLGALGLAYADLGDTPRAREYLTQALRIFEAIEDPRAAQARRDLAALEE